MTQPTSAAIWTAVQAAIASAAGVPMNWKYANAPQPDVDYGVLSLGSFATEGFDYVQEQAAPAWATLTPYAVGSRVLNDSNRTYTATTAGTSGAAPGPTGTGSAILDGSVTWAFVPAGSEVALTVGGVRNVMLQLEVWSASLVEQDAKPAAETTLDNLVTRLRLPTARAALAAVGVTPFDPGPVQWLPSIVSAGFRGRATCDVRCRVPARALTEYVAFIASLSVGVDAGSGVTRTISAP